MGQRTVLTFRLRLVQDDIVDIEVSNVADVKRHDIAVTTADIIVGSLASTICLRTGSGKQRLHHLEYIAQFAWIQRGTGQYARESLAILQCDDARKSLSSPCQRIAPLSTMKSMNTHSQIGQKVHHPVGKVPHG